VPSARSRTRSAAGKSLRPSTASDVRYPIAVGVTKLAPDETEFDRLELVRRRARLRIDLPSWHGTDAKKAMMEKLTTNVSDAYPGADDIFIIQREDGSRWVGRSPKCAKACCTMFRTGFAWEASSLSSHS
jgi:hypothetical protein